VMAIPWFTLPPLDLDAVGLGKLYWFAVLVVIGIVLGVMFYDRITLRGGDVDVKLARLMPEAGVIGGFVGAHLVHVLIYHPELMAEDRWVLLKFWAGISSMGGFFGGALACIALLLYYRQRMIPYGDRALFALSIGWIFGRLGCATSHDHPGRLTDFFLAVQFHDGIRHDLGLYEFLYTVVLVGVLFWWTRRPWRTGSVMAIVLCSYGPVRFGLDFLRATDRDFVDVRYLGLTPAQYGAAALTVAGAILLYLSRSKKWPVQPPLWGPLAPPIRAAVPPAEAPPPAPPTT